MNNLSDEKTLHYTEIPSQHKEEIKKKPKSMSCSQWFSEEEKTKNKEHELLLMVQLNENFGHSR